MKKNQILIISLLLLLALNQGYAQICADALYYDYADSSCKVCQTNCNYCTGPTDCFKCASGYYIDETSLSSNINNANKNPSQIFDQALAPTLICKKCQIENCSYCSYQQPDVCQYCNSEFFYDEINKLCKPCFSGCQGCYDQLTCYYCGIGKLFEPSLDEKTPGTCVNCPSNCDYCLNTNECNYCKSTYYLISSQDNTNGQCAPCMKNCQVCTDSTDCQYCDNGMYFQKKTSTCVAQTENCEIWSQYGCDQCKYGFFFNEDGGCTACTKNCIQCKSLDYCDYCEKTFFLDSNNALCTACSQNCLQCSSTTTCYYCQAGYRVGSQGECLPCAENCQSCDEQSCYQCLANFYLLNNYTENTQSCQKCSENCDICHQGADDNQEPRCSQCKFGYEVNYKYSDQQYEFQKFNGNNNQSYSQNNTYFSQEYCPYNLSNTTGYYCDGICNYYLNFDSKSNCSSGSCQFNVTSYYQSDCDTFFTYLSAKNDSRSEKYVNITKLNETDAKSNLDSGLNFKENCSINCIWTAPKLQEIQGNSTCHLICQRVVQQNYTYTSQQPVVEPQCVVGYGFFIDKVDNQLKTCNYAIPNCQSCGYGYQPGSMQYWENPNSTDFMCYYCYYSEYYDQKSNLCLSCQNSLPNCQSCHNSTFCNWCLSGYAITQKGQCLQCSIKLCNYCHFDGVDQTEMCDSCIDGHVFNQTSKQCVPCSNYYPGCGYCGLKYNYDDKYYTQSNDSSSQTTSSSSTADSSYENGETSQNPDSKYTNVNITVECYSCQDYQQIFDKNQQQCVQCSSIIPNCQGCHYDYYTYSVICNNCGDNKFYDQLLNVCQSCSGLISNCRSCYKNYSYSYQDDYSTTPNSGYTDDSGATDGSYSSGTYSSDPYSSDPYSSGTYSSDPYSSDPYSSGTYSSDPYSSGTYSSGTYDSSLNQSNYSNSSFPKYDTYYQATMICSKCDNQYSLNLIENTCDKVDCPENCDNCYVIPGWQRSFCYYCNYGYIYNFENNLCLQNTCPIGTYFTGSECIKCSEKFENCYSCDNYQYFKPDFEIQDFVQWTYDIQKEKLTNAFVETAYCNWCYNGYSMNVYDQNRCQPVEGAISCPYGCSECDLSIGDVKCTACIAYYTLDKQSNYCFMDCQKQGLSGCLYCDYIDSNQTQVSCFYCQPGFILNPEKQECQIIPTCPSGSVFDPQLNDCTSCPEFCNGCNIELLYNNYTALISDKVFHCLSCQPKYKLDYQGQCIYQNENYVEPCPYGCVSCQFNTRLSVMDCLKCETSFALQIAQYTGEAQCILPCPENCIYCNVQNQGDSSDNQNLKIVCEFCSYDFVLAKDGSCILEKSCQQDFDLDGNLIPQFFNPNSKSCEQCLDNCKKCFWDDYAQYARCSQCTSDYKLTTDLVCQKKLNDNENNCPQGAFEDPKTKECKRCGDKCLSCQYQQQLNQITCTQCIFGYDVDTINGGVCVLSELITTQNGEKNKNNYKEIIQGQKINNSNSNSSSNNNQGHSNSLLVPSKPTGASTNSLSAKISCNEGYYISEAGLNYIQSMNSSSNNNNEAFTSVSSTIQTNSFCVACPNGCSKCKWNPDLKIPFCFTCINAHQYHLNEVKGVCFNKKCPKGSIFSPSNGCDKCPNKCNVCERTSLGYMACSECISGFAPNIDNPSICQFNAESCPAGTFADVAGGYCKACPKTCNLCTLDSKTSAIQCSECVSVDYTLTLDKKCTKSCSSTQYFGPGGDLGQYDCYACPLGCTACTFDELTTKQIKCTACNLNYFTLDQQVGKCRLIEGTFVTASTNLCTSPKVLTISKDGFYYSCRNCPTGCADCFYDTTIQDLKCKTCISGFTFNSFKQTCNLDISQLKITCQNPDQQYVDFNKMSCVSCPSSCVKCITAPASKLGFACTACSEGFNLRDDLCLLTCSQPSQMPVLIKSSDGSSAFQQQCQPCSAPCQNCKMNYLSIPPIEVCMACDSGFFLDSQNGATKCSPLPECPNGQFAALQTAKSSGSSQQPQSFYYESYCSKCPFGCSKCSAADPTKPFSNVKCTLCTSSTDYQLNENGQCIASFQINKPTCKSKQALLFISNTKTWSCQDCPQSCTECEINSDGTKFFCLSCVSGSFLKKDESKKTAECVSIPPCTLVQGQYSASDDQGSTFQCLSCPQSCATCERKNVLDPQSLICLSCNSGFNKNLKGTKCEKVYSSSLGISANSCPERQYPTVVDGLIKCSKCPAGCNICGLTVPTQSISQNNVLSCSSCLIGYTLQNGQCQQKCKVGQFYSVTYNECQPCIFPCTNCLSDAQTDCLACAEGYTLKASSTTTTTTTCQLKSNIQTTQITCGKNSVFSKSDNLCKCLNPSDILNTKDLQCYSQKQWLDSSYNQACGVGQYKDSYSNQCRPCYSKDSSNLCTACLSGQAQDCLSCPSGYFLDKSSYSCQRCAEGCEACLSATSCERCQPGFYEHFEKDQVKQTFIVKCLTQCPSGTLPSIQKFYLQNKELFSDQEISDKLDLSQKKPDLQANSNSAFASAIGIFQEPVYGSLPWQYNDQGQPIYSGQLVRLSCAPCREGCAACYGEDQYYLPSTKVCYKDQCPSTYVKKLVAQQQQCALPESDEFAVQSCTQKTISPDSQTQSIYKKYFVVCTTSYGGQILSNSNNNLRNLLASGEVLSYTWSLIDVKKDNIGIQKEGVTVTDMNEDYDLFEKQEIQSSFFNGVKQNKTFLDVPSANLKKNTEYQLRLTATILSQKKTAISSVIRFFARDEDSKKSLEDLITPDLISVLPASGVSGEATFTAQYTLDNGNEKLGFLKQSDASSNDSKNKKWKITIKVGEDSSKGGASFTSFNLNDQIKFTVPPNTVSDSDISIIFQVSNGEQTFTAKRMITALRNENFNIAKSPLIQKLSQTGSTVNANDLASAASTIMAQITESSNKAGVCANLQAKLDNLLQGPCTTSESSPCCGHGTCQAVKALNTGDNKYYCQCSSGWAGKACQTPAEVQTQMKAISTQILNSATNTPATAENADSLINSLTNSATASVTLDSATSTKVFSKLKEIGSLCTDQGLLTNVLGSITTTTMAATGNDASSTSTSSNDNNNKKAAQEAALDAMKTAVSKFATTLDASNPEVAVNAQGIQSKSKYVDVTDIGINDKVSTRIDPVVNSAQSGTGNNRILGTTTSTLATEISLKQSVFSGKTVATISSLQLEKDALSNFNGGDKIVSKNLEISLINPVSGAKYNIADVAGNCPIQFVLQATVSGTQGKTAKCKYYDAVQGQFTEQGCSTYSRMDLGNNNIKVTCCCNHLSTFTIIEEETVLGTNPNVYGNLIMLPILTLLFVIALIL